MLPPPTSKEFPDALKARRLELGFDFKKMSQITKFTIYRLKRYESTEYKDSNSPSLISWVTLNRALRYEIDDPDILDKVNEITDRNENRSKCISRQNIIKSDYIKPKLNKPSMWFPT